MNEANYIVSAEHLDTATLYSQVLRHAQALIQDESDFLANCANLSSLLYHSLPNLNWCGMYFVYQDELLVGPFQGKPACTRIVPGKGVCGAALTTGEVQCVEDVHAFPGHIACDPNSRSELVVPIRYKAEIIGVLDIDSPLPARFGPTEVQFCTALIELLCSASSAESVKRIAAG